MEFETSVKEVIARTYNVKSFRFPRPASLSYKAGQFMFITIRIKDKQVKKCFSISSSPTEKDLEFTKKFTGSEFSQALNDLKVGDWAKIDAPFGTFTFEGEYEKIGMLSGGVGITPLRSICKYCTDKELGTRITLLYGNHSEEDIVFRDDFGAMQKRDKNLKVILTLEDYGENWTGRKGRITPEMITEEIPDYSERVFYTCGPPGMVESMEGLLRNIGISEKQRKREDFAGY